MLPLLIVLLPLSLSAQRTVSRRVFISAVNESGAPVLDLTAGELQVTENDSKREVTRLVSGSKPLRVVLLADSSTAMGPMLNSFRGALTAFFDTLPPPHEIAFVSSGGQLRVRTPPTADRQLLKSALGIFANDGGANAVLDTMMEADKRFLKTAPDQWPVLVIITTDRGETRREPNIDEYNRFMNDFLARGGAAHSVVVVGQQSGLVSDLVQNLTENMGGLRFTINTDNALPMRVKEIAERLLDDYKLMEHRYQVDYTGDGSMKTPVVNVSVGRPGVRLQMSPRRPF